MKHDDVEVALSIEREVDYGDFSPRLRPARFQPGESYVSLSPSRLRSLLITPLIRLSSPSHAQSCPAQAQ